ncbi:MAG: hypothetical protein K1W02_08310 [Muribaculaceae bacterium]
MFSKRASAINCLLSYVLAGLVSGSNLSGSSNNGVSGNGVTSGAVNNNLFYGNFLNYYSVAVNSGCILVTTTANHGYAEKYSK